LSYEVKKQIHVTGKMNATAFVTFNELKRFYISKVFLLLSLLMLLFLSF